MCISLDRAPRPTCSCHAYNGSIGASPRHRGGTDILHDSRTCSLLGDPPLGYSPRDPGPRLRASRVAGSCSATRSSRQSEEWFEEDPLSIPTGSVSEIDTDSVLFLTGSKQYDNLFCETEEDAAAQLDRRWRSLNGSASTSSSRDREASNQDPVISDQPTELILQLVKYGSGWGEEIFPRASLVQRPIEKKQRIRNRSSLPDPWTVRPQSCCAAVQSGELERPAVRCTFLYLCSTLRATAFFAPCAIVPSALPSPGAFTCQTTFQPKGSRQT